MFISRTATYHVYVRFSCDCSPEREMWYQLLRRGESVDVLLPRFLKPVVGFRYSPYPTSLDLRIEIHPWRLRHALWSFKRHIKNAIEVDTFEADANVYMRQVPRLVSLCDHGTCPLPYRATT